MTPSSEHFPGGMRASGDCDRRSWKLAAAFQARRQSNSTAATTTTALGPASRHALWLTGCREPHGRGRTRNEAAAERTAEQLPPPSEPGAVADLQ